MTSEYAVIQAQSLRRKGGLNLQLLSRTKFKMQPFG
jgi:hypothetical protein